MPESKYIHLPFNHQTCPYEDCAVEGSVPGIKRHVKFVHGKKVYASLLEDGKFRELRSPEVLKDVSTEQLFLAAVNRKLVKPNEEEAERELLIKALTS